MHQDAVLYLFHGSMFTDYNYTCSWRQYTGREDHKQGLLFLHFMQENTISA